MNRGPQASRSQKAPPLPLPAMTNPHKGRTGLDRFIRATGHSINGMQLAYRHESAFRAELGVAAVLLPSAFWLGRSWIEVALLAGSVLLVLIVELLNTGIETVVDRIGLERHELSGLAKDVGSTAVLLSFAVLIVIWGFVLFARV